jgi:hypothetical protein
LNYLSLLLLAINVLLLVANLGWVNLLENREPDRLRRQIDAEKITLLVGEGRSPVAAPEPKPVASSNVPVGAPTLASDGLKAEGAAAANVCLEFPPMDADRAKAVETSIKREGISVDIKNPDAEASFMVYLAPSESIKEAQRKLGELKRQGVADAFLLQDGPLKFGISLGLFRAEEGAKNLVQQLANKGIRSAKIGPGSVARNGRVVLRAIGSPLQLARVKTAAAEASLDLKPCPTP